MLLYCFVSESGQCSDISINVFQCYCTEIFHSMCCQIVHQVGRLLHIMACSHLGIAFFHAMLLKTLSHFKKERCGKDFSVLQITPKHCMMKLKIAYHADDA